MNVANAITVLRGLLIPVIAWLLLNQDYEWVFWLFVFCALGDLADGVIARRWNQRTRFGAVADPLADKLTMLTVTWLLAVQHFLPWWFAIAVIARDVVIVAGAAAYHFVIGHVDMVPSWLSKLNTAFEFALLAGTLAFAAGYLDEGPWFAVMLYATTATIALSGAQYVIEWGLKAKRTLAAGR